MRRARTKDHSKTLLNYYDAMFTRLGEQFWWPGRTRFEVMVGAILTQNTAWTNVEKAIKNLRAAKLLNPLAMHRVGTQELALNIKSAGYFNVKATRLKNLTRHLFTNYDGSLDKFLGRKGNGLREELLSLSGIGPETADSILLYAALHPEFVVDAYTRRIFSRHGLVSEAAGYDEVKALFTDNLPADAAMFNEYHALIVKVGKDYCRTKAPRCGECPLRDYL